MSGVAALKGFRTQLVYSLHYILNCNKKDAQYHLEGFEDLDIFDAKGNLIEVIQVKNLKASISLSDILSKEHTSFLKRYIKLANEYTEVVPTLATFSIVAPELSSWLVNKSEVSKKERAAVAKYNIREHDWFLIKGKLTIDKVTEEKLVSETISTLKSIFTFTEPETTAELLLYWLYVKLNSLLLSNDPML